jgi:hypothetical protein
MFFSKARNNKLTKQNTKTNQIFFIYKNGKTTKLNKNQDHKIKIFSMYSLHAEFTWIKEIQNREGCGSALSMFIHLDSIHPSTFMKTNQGYQLPVKNLPASIHKKTPEIMEKPKTQLASQTPNNSTKEFWHPRHLPRFCILSRAPP